MKSLVVAVVLPSLNEEARLKDACASLGFGEARHPPPDTFLFIVDNGSTDRTLELAREIKQTSPQGTVFVEQEDERGYVPPRHMGNILAKELSERRGWSLSNVLILQADADTKYDAEYIKNMRSISQALGSNLLLEGLAKFPNTFKESFSNLVNLCFDADSQVFSMLNLSEAGDLICTDSVSGYLLSDYLVWGGHLREYRNDGEEIHAETTRLYMRSLVHGTQKVRAERALAYPSARKIERRPAEEIATAGFPREISWRDSWELQHRNSRSIDYFNAHLDHPTLLHAIQTRKLHSIALFGILPLHVARALGTSPPLPPNPALVRVAELLPQRDKTTLASHPGAFITDVLDLVDHRGSIISDFLADQGRFPKGM
jgi:glycosyltransferase involved in cell wall biosynthesis